MSDQHCVPFIGVLELVAAIERLEPDEHEHERVRTEPVQPPPRS